jgi:glycine betaine transporter
LHRYEARGNPDRPCHAVQAVSSDALDRRFLPTLLGCVAVAVVAWVVPSSFGAHALAAVAAVIDRLDALFLGTASALVILCVWLALGPHGKRRLGRDDERPEFSTFAWISMLFAAGMGSGLMFWGVAEPMTHYARPPVGAPSAAVALALTDIHWGVHAWAIYAIAALVLAWFHFRRGADYLPGAPIRALARGGVTDKLAHVADITGALAIAFGVAGSIGMAVLQIRGGLAVAWGTAPDSVAVAVAVLVIMTVAYTASAASRLERGIKWLSTINVVVACVFVLALVVLGPAGKVADALGTSLVAWAQELVPLATMSGPWPAQRPWVHEWTIAYLVWWIAWAPFVGVFVARISRGRTIREFVTATVLVPTLFSMLWFAVLGGTAIAIDDGSIASVAVAEPPQALFVMLQRLPGTQALSLVAVVLVMLFLITSVDSAAYVLGMITSGGAADPPRMRKLAWGLVLGLLGGALVFTAHIDVVRAVAIIGAIPFTLVLLVQTAALVVALRRADPPAS